MHRQGRKPDPVWIRKGFCVSEQSEQDIFSSSQMSDVKLIPARNHGSGS